MLLQYSSPPGGPCPRYPFRGIPHLLPCKGRLVRSVRIFTRTTYVEIGFIILQKLPLPSRFTKGECVGNLSNTPVFPLTYQNFVMFEPNNHRVQIYCCSLAQPYRCTTLAKKHSQSGPTKLSSLGVLSIRIRKCLMPRRRRFWDLPSTTLPPRENMAIMD